MTIVMPNSSSAFLHAHSEKRRSEGWVFYDTVRCASTCGFLPERFFLIDVLKMKRVNGRSIGQRPPAEEALCLSLYICVRFEPISRLSLLAQKREKERCTRD